MFFPIIQAIIVQRKKKVKEVDTQILVEYMKKTVTTPVLIWAVPY